MMRIFEFCPRNTDNDSESSDIETECADNHEIQIFDEPSIKNRVTFSENNDVYIIPNNDTYYNEKCVLWWSQDDLTNAKKSSYKEIIQFTNLNPNIHFNIARKAIYQSKVYFELIIYYHD